MTRLLTIGLSTACFYGHRIVTVPEKICASGFGMIEACSFPRRGVLHSRGVFPLKRRTLCQSHASRLHTKPLSSVSLALLQSSGVPCSSSLKNGCAAKFLPYVEAAPATEPLEVRRRAIGWTGIPKPRNEQPQ